MVLSRPEGSSEDSLWGCTQGDRVRFLEGTRWAGRIGRVFGPDEWRGEGQRLMIDLEPTGGEDGAHVAAHDPREIERIGGMA